MLVPELLRFPQMSQNGHLRPQKGSGVNETQSAIWKNGAASGWDVFDRAGRYLGVVNMPPRFQPRLFHEDEIYGVWRDDIDVQYVVRRHVIER